jgi:hypothetical protein
MKNTFREYIKTELADYLPDIARYGCAGGFPGLTYYKDTVALFDQYRDDIFEILGEMADGMGQNIPELIASFNGAADVGNFAQFANLCVWAATEEIARSEEYLQEMEKEVAERA